MSLAAVESCPVFCRSHANEAFESSGKVALVRESGGRSNRCQRRIGRIEGAAGMFDAKLTNIFSNSTAVELAKFARQMHRMYAY